MQEVSNAAINVLKARELQAGPGDETALEVHVGEHAEESHNFVRHMVRCSFGLKMGLFDPTLVNAACYISVISRANTTSKQSNHIGFRKKLGCIHVQNLPIRIAIASGMSVELRMGGFIK